MSKLQSFVELLIKQTCRRAAHEYEINNRSGSKTPKKSTSALSGKTGIYALDFLKSLHDKSRDHMYKLLKIPYNIAKAAKIPNGMQWINSSDFGRAEREKLLEFLVNVKELSPPKSKQWIDLQHFMQHIYRNFANANPDPSAETLSTFFINEVRELVKSLIEVDETQLYLRIVALLREYCIFAQWNYSKGGDHAITKLFYYYEAMLSAAKNCSAAFQEFEVIIYKNYSVCWIDFNTCVFIRYFFETDYVQLKIYQCLEFKESPGDTPAMFGLLEDLKNLWVKEQKRIMKINEEASVDNTTDFYYIEEAMINCHKKVLKCNFWIQRTPQELEDLDLRRLDHHIFRLLFDPLFHPAGPILDKNGQCICEECLIAKYKTFLDAPVEEVNEKILKNVERLSFCRRCEMLVRLEEFHKHINTHSGIEEDYDSPEMLTNGLPVELNDKDGKPPNLKDACEIHFKHFDEDRKNEMETTMEAFEEYLRQRKEGGKCDQILSKNVRSFIKIKKDIFNNSNGQLTEKVFDMFKQNAQNTNIPKKIEPESKIKDLRKNGHKCEKPYSSCKSTLGKPACEHICKHEETKGTCQGHNATCDHVKDTKKCDCTYCEVFGTSVTSHVHKNNELRDRLRIRLHQRREKRTKDMCKNSQVAAAANNNNNNSLKLKTVVSKVEERVPLPSSPTNIPPAPIVKSSESSVTSSGTDDIHGLVSYIEGNSVLNKMELAQKKAAKKARQRQKKEEERLKAEEEQKRLAEEIKRKEAERKKELARKKAEKERAEAAASQMKFDSKKNKKQIDRKSMEKSKKSMSFKTSIVEETIPAMVTIKRIEENGEGAPTVTITLKGSTPDQDKLLYTLVSGPVDQNDKDKENENNNNSKKKKKKQKTQIPTVVTKELKVTVTLDPNKPVQQDPNLKKLNKNNHVNYVSTKNPSNKQKETKKELNSLADLPIPMLRLPPGITITKVEGPICNRNYQVSNMEEQKGPTINVAKSGVIVVDTEKLIQSKQTNDLTKNKNNKKNKKKKNKKQTEINGTPISDGSKKMITLKNPIFQSLQTKPPESSGMDKNTDTCAPAAIFTNENGMVTIRSSRLQQSLMNGVGLTPLQLPKLLPEIQAPSTNLNSFTHSSVQEDKNEIISSFNAQEILSALPGIEITKVDKKAVKLESDINKSCQTAQVSIIPTSNGGDKFDFDKDDWLYESVFSPRDVLEDDMDAEELELEAFKRFCQQSVPPPRKEKVAHLNVADIVLKKKTDINFV